MESRYARQLPLIGPEGQARLGQKSALVVGAGGLGSGLLFALAGAGVGRIGIVERDTISESNLNRQFLYSTADIGRPKAEAALARLRAYNPEIAYTLHDCLLDEGNAEALLMGYDTVFLAADNLPARLAANRAALALRIPLINGGVSGFLGTVQTVLPGEGPCLACTHRGAPLPDAGAFPPTVAAVSALMAEAGLLLLLGRPAEPGLLFFDGEDFLLERLPLVRDEGCEVCGK